MINLTCPHCRQPLAVPDDSAGKKATCPQCGNLVDVPAVPTFTETAAPPPPGPSPIAMEPVMSPDSQAYESPRISPAETGGMQRPALEYAIISLILGGVGFLTAPLIIVARMSGVFPPIMLGLAVIGVGALGLVLAIFGMIRTVSQRLESFWYVLSALVLSGLAIICGLTMFIAALTMPSAGIH